MLNRKLSFAEWSNQIHRIRYASTTHSNETIEEVTFEGSTLWKFLTTEITRSVTSDLSRNDPLTSSEKRRRSTELEGSAGDGLTLTLRYRSRAFLAAIAVFQKDNPGGVCFLCTLLSLFNEILLYCYITNDVVVDLSY